MIGYKNYEVKMGIKKQYYKNNNIKVIWYTSKDILNNFYSKDLDIKSTIYRYCSWCKIQSRVITKSLCKNCYSSYWKGTLKEKDLNKTIIKKLSEQQIKEMLLDGLSNQDIAVKIGLKSYTTICRWRKEYNIPVSFR